MKGKTFLILLVVAGVLAALAYLRIGDEKTSGAAKMGAPLFADLPVNQVASIVIADAEHSVTVVKGAAFWQVEERHGYPADFEELRETVVKLSRLKVGRSFGGSPESFQRLALLPPAVGAGDGQGKRITLKDASGESLADVIVGQHRETEDGGSGGQYIRKADEETVFLVDNSFRFLKTAPADWLQKEILAIKADDVESVTCFAEDSQTPLYTLSRPNPGEPPRLSPVPPGRTADGAKIDQVFDALSPLTLDDVAVAVDPPPTSERPRLVYRLYDGRQISLYPQAAGEDKYTVQVTAEDLPGAVTKTAELAKASDSVTSSDESKTASAAEENETAAAAKTGQQLDAELRPWRFTIKKWQFDSLITQPEALLEEQQKEGAAKSS